MKIKDMYKPGHCVFSIECFPPKKAVNFDKMKDNLRKMAEVRPEFISVTFGAGGSANTVSTVQVTDFVKNELHIEAIAHVICMGADKASIKKTVEDLHRVNVSNVLALRGDVTPLRPFSEDFPHANILMQYIRSLDPEMGISGACYPESHPESSSEAEDIHTLKLKEEAGASDLISQLFFDNSKYYRFLENIKIGGVRLPVTAGIMPIVKKTQIERTVALSSASMPSDFTRMISLYQDDPDSLYSAGIDYAVKQIRDLIDHGADGIHLYAMNNADVAVRIYDGIKDLL